MNKTGNIVSKKKKKEMEIKQMSRGQQCKTSNDIEGSESHQGMLLYLMKELCQVK